MNTLEYKNKLKELEQRYEEEKESLDKEFIISQSDVKEGDIVGDGKIMIRVIKIAVTVWNPTIYYIGRKVNEITKNLTRDLNLYNVFEVKTHIKTVK